MCECVCVCVCVFVCERDCIRESHTQLHSPGDLCQPVILPCTPPSFLLLTAEIGQPHIMKGATRGKYAPPSAHLPVPLRAHTRYLYRPTTEKQAMTPHGHTGGRLSRDRHSQPQHANLQPQQPFTQPRLSRADSSVSYGMCTPTRQTRTIGLKRSAPTKLNEMGEGNWTNLIMDIVCIVWNSLQSQNCSSLLSSWGAQDGGRWRKATKSVYRDCDAQTLKGHSTHLEC